LKKLNQFLHDIDKNDCIIIKLETGIHVTTYSGWAFVDGEKGPIPAKDYSFLRKDKWKKKYKLLTNTGALPEELLKQANVSLKLFLLS